MRDHHIDLCGQIDFTRTEAMPLLRGMHISALRAMAAATAAVAERTLYFQALTCGALQPGCACRRRSWRGDIAGPALAR